MDDIVKTVRIALEGVWKEKLLGVYVWGKKAILNNKYSEHNHIVVRGNEVVILNTKGNGEKTIYEFRRALTTALGDEIALALDKSGFSFTRALMSIQNHEKNIVTDEENYWDCPGCKNSFGSDTKDEKVIVTKIKAHQEESPACKESKSPIILYKRVGEITMINFEGTDRLNNALL